MPSRRTGSTPADLRRFAERLPAVEAAPAQTPRSWSVNGKAFVFYRGPRKDAVDASGELLTDVIVFSTPDLAAKDALVADARSPFFTTPHFNGWKGVLLRQAHLAQVPPDELEEVVVEAWLARAPQRLAKEYLAAQGIEG